MTAWKLFRHAFLMLVRNLGAAFRVSLLPSLAIILIWGLGASAIMAGQITGTMTTGGIAIIALVLLATIFFLSLCAVSWHRFVLVEEPANWLPQIRVGPIRNYALRSLATSIGLALMVMAAAIPTRILGLGSDSGMALGLVLGMILSCLLFTVYWRLMASLPGAALDTGAGLREVWAATSGQMGTLLMLSAIVIGGSVLGGAILALLRTIPVLGAVAELGANWFLSMLALSLLTTLYGHYIEKRPLV